MKDTADTVFFPNQFLSVTKSKKKKIAKEENKTGYNEGWMVGNIHLSPEWERPY